MNEVIIFAIDRDNEPKYIFYSIGAQARAQTHAHTHTITNTNRTVQKTKGYHNWIFILIHVHNFSCLNTLNGSIVSCVLLYKVIGRIPIFRVVFSVEENCKNCAGYCFCFVESECVWCMLCSYIWRNGNNGLKKRRRCLVVWYSGWSTG